MAARVTTKGKPSYPAPAPSTIINADADTIVMAKPGSLRARIVQWKAWRLAEPNVSDRELAERLGISARSLRHSIKRAVKEGWLHFEDPIDRIDHEVIPLVMDNLKEFLVKKDRRVTLETAKSTIYKVYTDSKGVNDAPPMAFALKIETEPTDVKAISGCIVGVPRKGAEGLSES